MILCRLPQLFPFVPIPRDLGGPTGHGTLSSPRGMSPHPVLCPCPHPAPGDPDCSPASTVLMPVLSQCLHPVLVSLSTAPFPLSPPAPCVLVLVLLLVPHPTLLWCLSPSYPSPFLLPNVPVPSLPLLSPFPSCSQCLHNFPTPHVPIPCPSFLVPFLVPLLPSCPCCSSCFHCPHHCAAPCVPDLILLAVSLSLSCF